MGSKSIRFLYEWGGSCRRRIYRRIRFRNHRLRPGGTTTDRDQPPDAPAGRLGKYYLSFDGIDDYLSTGSIDFTATDKMTVLAGVRKINALGTLGMLAELSTSSASNPGLVALGAPSVSGHYQFLSKGTAEATANATNAALAGPITSVIAGLGSISGAQSILRVNGTQADQSTADQGTGNYGNYPLYIGRRGGTTNPFNGNLYGLIVRGAQTDDLHLTNAEKYLAYNQESRYELGTPLHDRAGRSRRSGSLPLRHAGR